MGGGWRVRVERVTGWFDSLSASQCSLLTSLEEK